MIEFIFFVVIVFLLAVATLRNYDAFPFSRYPMFSKPAEISQIRVIRIAFEMRNKDVVWWKSRFYRYPEFVGRSLENLVDRNSSDERTNAFLELEKQRLLHEVLRLVEQEKGPLPDISALRVIKRTGAWSGNKLTAADELVDRVPIGKLSKT